MSKNERTSKTVAKIAAKLLAIKRTRVNLCMYDDDGFMVPVNWSDIRALAASCLSQTADHSDHETIRKGKLPKGHKRTKVHAPVRRRLHHR